MNIGMTNIKCCITINRFILNHANKNNKFKELKTSCTKVITISIELELLEQRDNVPPSMSQVSHQYFSQDTEAINIESNIHHITLKTLSKDITKLNGDQHYQQ